MIGKINWNSIPNKFRSIVNSLYVEYVGIWKGLQRRGLPNRNRPVLFWMPISTIRITVTAGGKGRRRCVPPHPTVNIEKSTMSVIPEVFS